MVALMNGLKERIESRQTAAVQTWRRLIEVAVGGKDLSEKQTVELEDAAATLKIEDVFETFSSDCEIWQAVKAARATEAADAERAEELLQQATDATNKIEQIMSVELPRLRGLQADGWAQGNGIQHGLARLRETVRQNPRLFTMEAPEA